MEPQNIEQKLQAVITRLAPAQQLQVYEYAARLAGTERRGVPGQSLLQFAGAIPVEELALMTQAIQAGCEKVDLDEW
jgi:hypothetical protein